MSARPPAAAADDPVARETPGFIPAGEHVLYGVLHAVPAPCDTVVVHCHSAGVEQLTVYRAEVLAARRCAAAGIPVLRWHARGHGDSSGDFADVTADTLLEDARIAARHALDVTGARHIVWLGVLLGGVTAARAAATTPGSAGLALWQPACSPEAYFRSQLRALLFSEAAQGHRSGWTVDSLMERLAHEGRIDVRGYYLHRTLVDSLRPHTIGGALGGWRGPTLIVQIDKRRTLAAEFRALAAQLESQGAPVTVEQVLEEPGWHFYSNLAWESEALADATARWVRTVAGG